MKKDKLDALYHNFLDSEEFERVFKEIEIDLTWLDGKISLAEMMRLEAMVHDYGNCNGSALFEGGVRYAWELFMALSEKNVGQERIK